jgi:hypothetical protein
MNSHYYAVHPWLLWMRETATLQIKRSTALLTNVVAPPGAATRAAPSTANPSSRNITHAAMSAVRSVFATSRERPLRRDRPSRMSYLDGARMSREMDRL